VAFTNLAPTPVRSAAIETALMGAAADPDIAGEAAGALRDDELDPWDDLRGTAALKRRMARDAAARAIGRAILRAGGPAATGAAA
jgi:carbon-monoxide dehydrogenase medium subunit